MKDRKKTDLSDSVASGTESTRSLTISHSPSPLSRLYDRVSLSFSFGWIPRIRPLGGPSLLHALGIGCSGQSQLDKDWVGRNPCTKLSRSAARAQGKGWGFLWFYHHRNMRLGHLLLEYEKIIHFHYFSQLALERGNEITFSFHVSSVKSLSEKNWEYRKFINPPGDGLSPKTTPFGSPAPR